MSPTAARAGVSFEIEQLDVIDDRLVITGHWSGVRGMRFVRPTLVVGDRQVHATLEHKPWAQTTGEPWTAAFPWRRDDDVDVSRLELAVAPSVTVALGPAREDDEATWDPGQRLEEALARLDEREARCRQLEAALQAEREVAFAATTERDEHGRARIAAERERDQALGQRDEAVHGHAAAVRTRDRMQRQHDAAVAARDAAQATLDEAIAERDWARAQREEVLAAYRALERRLQRELADADRLRTEALPAVEPVTPQARSAAEPVTTQPWSAAEPAMAPTPAAPDPTREVPIGVRRIPAARTVLAELQRPEPARKFVVSTFDLWAIRVLGSVAAACFILLLVLIVRVFL